MKTNDQILNDNNLDVAQLREFQPMVYAYIIQSMDSARIDGVYKDDTKEPKKIVYNSDNMEKLIKELEVAKDEYESEYHKGINLAIEIIRKHDPWIDVIELPPMEIVNGKKTRYSITVLGKYDNKIIGEVFCHENEKTGIPDWFIIGKPSPVNITKWTYLPGGVSE